MAACSSLEESVGAAVFEVRRSDGAIGEVSVTLATVDATAVTSAGIMFIIMYMYTSTIIGTWKAV